MNVLRDDWTPLFRELESKVNADGRRKILFQMIGDVQDVTMLNFGETGLARPSEWPSLSTNYAEEKHDGNRIPTLILTGALQSGFVHEVDSEQATLTNTVPYADLHQFGEGYLHLPARPFYPVTSDGENLTPFMEARLEGIVQSYFETNSAAA